MSRVYSTQFACNANSPAPGSSLVPCKAVGLQQVPPVATDAPMQVLYVLSSSGPPLHTSYHEHLLATRRSPQYRRTFSKEGHVLSSLIRSDEIVLRPEYLVLRPEYLASAPDSGNLTNIPHA